MSSRMDGMCCKYKNLYFNACPLHDRDLYKEIEESMRKPLELVPIEPTLREMKGSEGLRNRKLNSRKRTG